MTVGEIRAALVALIARIDGAQVVTNSAPQARQLQAPSPQTGTIAVGSTVELTTQAGVDKEGKPFEKVVALRVLQAGTLTADADDIPF